MSQSYKSNTFLVKNLGLERRTSVVLFKPLSPVLMLFPLPTEDPTHSISTCANLLQDHEVGVENISYQHFQNLILK